MPSPVVVASQIISHKKEKEPAMASPLVLTSIRGGRQNVGNHGSVGGHDWRDEDLQSQIAKFQRNLMRLAQ